MLGLFQNRVRAGNQWVEPSQLLLRPGEFFQQGSAFSLIGLTNCLRFERRQIPFQDARLMSIHCGTFERLIPCQFELLLFHLLPRARVSD